MIKLMKMGCHISLKKRLQADLMTKVMWRRCSKRCLQKVRHSFSRAIVVRATLLLIFSMVALLVPPQERKINAKELFQRRAPYVSSYVPTWMMLIIVLATPICMFTLDRYEYENEVEFSQVNLAWTLALCSNAVITEILKVAIGRPRPDFFFRCFPDGQMVLDGDELDCTGKSRVIWEGRKSFPSGHTSYAFCSLGFVSMWLCGRWGLLSRTCEEKQFLKLVVCLLPLFVSAGIGVSRVCDNHHHWEDVMAGSVIGLLSSFFSYRTRYHSLSSELAGVPKIATM